MEDQRRGATANERDAAHGWLTVIAALLGTCVLVIAVLIASSDIRDRPLVGDEASHVIQALSLAEGGNLSYDQADLDRFASLGWRGSERPNGIIFQRYDHGWAFAKPYGWSLVAAPFVRVLGPVPGLAVASSLLFLITVAGAWFTCRPAGRAAALFAVTSVVASVTWLYGFNAHSDLFLAALTASIAAAFARWFATRQIPWIYVAGALCAVALSEKPTFALVLVPLLVVALIPSPGGRHVVGVVALAAATFALAVLPYLVYSSFASWNPYSGERYWGENGVTPFSPGAPPIEEFARDSGGESFSPSVIVDRLANEPASGLRATVDSLIGRHTGMLPFLPMTLIALIIGLRRGWRGDRVAVVAALGVVGYVVAYAFIFPTNYFGGEQSLGNRYLVQVSPLALLAVGRFPPQRRRLLGLTALGGVLAGVFLWPQFMSPRDSFVRLERSSAARDLLPAESDVVGSKIFRCGIPAGIWIPFESPTVAVTHQAEYSSCVADLDADGR